MSVNASSYGLGAVQLQEGQPVTYASASLTKTQQSYVQLEEEMLAAVFGPERRRRGILRASKRQLRLTAMMLRSLHREFEEFQQTDDLEASHAHPCNLYSAETAPRMFNMLMPSELHCSRKWLTGDECPVPRPIGPTLN